ncbi:alpha/beta hydrolase [Peribacillus sp. NPDC097675]|uniref:alpha/beta hydrolase n=1 Tax=Peribacillus sp. NPDC097675 TaxID=3390618 RepID=UPI003D00EF61
MKVHEKSIQTSGKEIRYTHIETGSNTVCFMFSGSGYNYDKPLFYYATMTMLQNKVDIIHVHYSYGEYFLKKPLEEISKTMMDDIHPVILDVLKNGEYTETIFLGKSLGTIPIVNDLFKRNEFLHSKVILLTPLLKFESIFDSLLNSEHQGLLVIGDKDPHYHSNQIDQLHSTNLQIEIVPHADHHLDIGEFETTHSLLALSRVMETLQNLVKTP